MTEEPDPQGKDPRTRRRRFALAASVVLFLAGALLLWKALPGDKGPVATFADPIVSFVSPASDREEASGNSGSSEGQPRNPRDRPRVRLAASHKASGPSIARVIIPSIGVKAPLIEMGTVGDGTLQVPARPEVTGWWNKGARPGANGTAVIVGHVDSQSGPAVFHDLGRVPNGARVTVVYKDGSKAAFAVSGRTRVRKSRFPTNKVYKRTPTPSLRLITCTGEFMEAQGHYRDNLILFARGV